MAKWLLPDNIADILPRQARTLESMRRTCLDLFSVHGFELVEPPLAEFAESLLTGSGSDVENNTFRFMDPASGKMLGVRADITPQIARIDAHILNRTAVTRLCYAGSCLHGRPMHPLASREPIVAGAELFGASGVEADAEMMSLAVETLKKLGIGQVHLDIGHIALVRSLLSGSDLSPAELHAVMRALRMKDPVALSAASCKLEKASAEALQTLLLHYGDSTELEALFQALPDTEAVHSALEEVKTLAGLSHADTVSFDFCDVHGYQYLTGVTFAVHIPQYAQAILRGGRYDGIGLAFGRSRPACGFTIYLRALATLSDFERSAPEVVAAQGPYDPELEKAVEALRREGRTVIRLLPGETLEDVREHYSVTSRLVRKGSAYALENS